MILQKEESFINRLDDKKTTTLGRYLVFEVADWQFVLNALQVKEIIPFVSPVSIPNSPLFLLGLINYRGYVIPLLDIFCKVKGISREYSPDSRLMVIDYFDSQIAIIVDRVAQIITATGEESADNLEEELTYFVKKRVVTLKQGKFLLLDLENLFSLK